MFIHFLPKLWHIHHSDVATFTVLCSLLLPGLLLIYTHQILQQDILASHKDQHTKHTITLSIPWRIPPPQPAFSSLPIAWGAERLHSRVHMTPRLILPGKVDYGLASTVPQSPPCHTHTVTCTFQLSLLFHLY